MQDTETHNISLEYKDKDTEVITIEKALTNRVQKAKFEVIKISSVTNTTAPTVEGAEFTAILTKYVDFYGSFDEALKHLDEFAEDEYSVFKTGADGHGISGLLAYGHYTVNETYCPSDRINPVEEFYVSIDKNSDGVIKELIENDTPFESYLKLVKVDEKTGKKVTLNNTTFSLYKLNEETNEWERVSCKIGKETFDTWTTDENATAYTETKLEAGKYKVDEIVVATGFLELDKEYIFEINRSNETLEYDEDNDAYITVTVKNEQPTGTLEVYKEMNFRDDVDTSLIEKDIDYTEISFELKATEDIIDYSDGSIIYEKGTVIGTYNLKSDATLKVENIPMGAYSLKEVTTVDGATLDETIYDVIFTQEDTKTKVYTVKLDIENYTTCVEISKTDITGEKELEGATLTVKDKDGNVVDTWVSGDKPHKIEGLLVDETYTLIEEIQVDGYVKATDIEFTVKNTNEIQKVTMIDKIVEMTKVDIAGNELEGATIQVLDKDNNIVDEWVSGKEPHKIKNLVEGETYILHEEICVEGYVKASDIEFTVSYDKETQKIEMVDKIVEITKTDLVTGEELEGAELEVIDIETGETVDKWTSTKEPHKVRNLEENKTYKLIETICPYGYEIAEEIEFTVTEDKETQKIEMKDMPILTDITLIKVDSDTKERIYEDFVFGIYSDENCTNLIEKYNSNSEDATIVFNEMRYGKFFIKEVSAPNGYQISDRIVEIEINDKGVFIDGEAMGTDKNGNYTFEFENTKIETPNTGDSRNTLLLGGIAGISALSLVGYGLYKLIKKLRNR